MKSLLTFLAVLSLPAFALAATIHVPADQPTIQEGINAASDNDTILVADGHYYERLNLLTKSILISSEILLDGDTSHIANTIIDADTNVLGASDTGSVIYAWNSDDRTNEAQIRGFVLQHGVGGAEGCVKAWLCDLTFSHCVIANNSGVALLRSAVNLAFDSCTISACPLGFDADSWIVQSSCEFTGCKLDSIPFYAPRVDIRFIGSTVLRSPIAISGFSHFVAKGSHISDCSIGVIDECWLEVDNSEIYDTDIDFWNGDISIVSSVLDGALTLHGTTRTTVAGSTLNGQLRCGYFSSHYLDFTNSIVISTDSSLTTCDSKTTVVLKADCSDFVFADPNWWDACECCVFDTSNVFSLDPLFCDTSANDFTLSSLSPCLPEHNGCSVLIGALGVGCEGVLCGDVTGNQIVDIDDIVYMICWVFHTGCAQPANLGQADVNCDAKYNLLDIVYLVNYVFAGGAVPCAECPL
jgi:hypothetical protein